MRCYTATIRATGQRYLYSVKISWDRRYFSADLGDTWHPTLRAARAAAVASEKIIWEG